MTNAHYHIGSGTFLSAQGVERRFFGVHPWDADAVDADAALADLRHALEADPSAGVGEIGLDRLKTREISPAQRTLFAAQLRIAAELRRPAVLHGAKCWGEVVKAARAFSGRIPAILFHGFSRSDGLLSEIFAMNGFIGVGKAVLNDHAVNYRNLVAHLPLDRILVETDDNTTADVREALLADIFAKVSELTGLSETALDANGLILSGMSD